MDIASNFCKVTILVNVDLQNIFHTYYVGMFMTYGHPLLCMFLADDFSRGSIFSASHCLPTVVDFQCQRVNSSYTFWEICNFTSFCNSKISGAHVTSTLQSHTSAILSSLTVQIIKYSTEVVSKGITFTHCGFVKTNWQVQKLNNRDTECNDLFKPNFFPYKNKVCCKRK